MWHFKIVQIANLSEIYHPAIHRSDYLKILRKLRNAVSHIFTRISKLTSIFLINMLDSVHLKTV